jgi:hypothetical protein
MPVGIGLVVACGYKVDMSYLCDFLGVVPKHEVTNAYAALKLDFWYFDLPPDQRAAYPAPGVFGSQYFILFLLNADPKPHNLDRYKLPDGTEEEPMVFLRTRVEIIRKESDMDERLHEFDTDVEKCNNFMEIMATASKSPVKFNAAALKFDVREWVSRRMQR